MPIKVIVKNNDINKALNKFKKKIKQSGILIEYINKQFFIKPSEIKKQEKSRAINRMKKNNNKE